MKSSTENSLRYGQVVLVDFPYTNLKQSKLRPAVVVSSQAFHSSKPDAIFVAITSQLNPLDAVAETPIEQWQQAGLHSPSVLKSIIATIQRDLVYEHLGYLAAADVIKLDTMLKKMIAISHV